LTKKPRILAAATATVVAWAIFIILVLAAIWSSGDISGKLGGTAVVFFFVAWAPTIWLICEADE
jgi:hypothetical protein